MRQPWHFEKIGEGAFHNACLDRFQIALETGGLAKTKAVLDEYFLVHGRERRWRKPARYKIPLALVAVSRQAVVSTLEAAGLERNRNGARTQVIEIANLAMVGFRSSAGGPCSNAEFVGWVMAQSDGYVLSQYAVDRLIKNLSQLAEEGVVFPKVC